MNRKVTSVAIFIAAISLICLLLILLRDQQRTGIINQSSSGLSGDPRGIQQNSVIDLPASREWQSGYAKTSPFWAIRWEDDTPIVVVPPSHVWFKLISMDGISCDEMIGYCRQLDKIGWRKRFVEDLYEVLARSGHTPPVTSKLVLLQADTDTNVQPIEEIASWTETNRTSDMVYEEAQEENNARIEQAKNKPKSTNP